MNRSIATALLLSTALGAAVALAQEPEAVMTLRSTVTGNQEQPKVLYLVPWQEPGGPEELYRPLQSLVSDVFAPVDRDEFRRELKFRQRMNGDTASGE